MAIETQKRSFDRAVSAGIGADVTDVKVLFWIGLDTSMAGVPE